MLGIELGIFFCRFVLDLYVVDDVEDIVSIVTCIGFVLGFEVISIALTTEESLGVIVVNPLVLGA